MFTSRFLLLLFLLSVLLFSCENEDNEPPSIEIISPSETAQYQVYDTIPVYYHVSDDRIVESVTIKLVNQDFIPVSGQQTKTIGAADFSGFEALVVDNRQLPTGTYYVLITATDGTNDKNAYVEVRVQEFPFALRAIYFADANSSGQNSIFRIDCLFTSVTPFVSIGQDVRKLSVNSMYDRLNIAGYMDGGIVQYDLAGQGIRWSASASMQPPAPTFLDMTSAAGNVYVSLYNDEIRGYTNDGALILNLQTLGDRPHTLYADENHLFVERRQIGGTFNTLFVYRVSNFFQKWELNLPMHVVAFCARTATELFIFGNYNGQAKVLLYNVENNSYWEPRTLPLGKLLHAVKGDGQTYFLAHENGLYSYTYSPNYLNQIGAGDVYQHLCFDRADGVLIGATRNEVRVIAGVQGAVVATFAHSDSIVSLDIHYTK